LYLILCVEKATHPVVHPNSNADEDSCCCCWNDLLLEPDAADCRHAAMMEHNPSSVGLPLVDEMADGVVVAERAREAPKMEAVVRP
jgi:hypothetical protein